MIVYISSTYNDLKDYRESVYRALSKIEAVNVIAMEDYVATDQRPVDKCMSDVEKCDVYVGIFAWRYGYIPPDHDKSITELEYRKAVETKKIKLIFLLNKKAKWPDKLKDTHCDQINKLKNELEEKYVVSYFQTKDELSEAALAAISNNLNYNKKLNFLWLFLILFVIIGIINTFLTFQKYNSISEINFSQNNIFCYITEDKSITFKFDGKGNFDCYKRSKYSEDKKLKGVYKISKSLISRNLISLEYKNKFIEKATIEETHDSGSIKAFMLNDCLFRSCN